MLAHSQTVRTTVSDFVFNIKRDSTGMLGSVLLFSILNTYIYFLYFDPENVVLDNEN